MGGSKNPLVRLKHIQQEIDQLANVLTDVTYDVFSESYVLRRTAEHAILIVSEAVKALSPAFTDHYTGVDWRAVRDIGNVLRHRYSEIDARILWLVITERLPDLRLVVERMIADASHGQGQTS